MEPPCLRPDSWAYQIWRSGTSTCSQPVRRTHVFSTCLPCLSADCWARHLRRWKKEGYPQGQVEQLPRHDPLRRGGGAPGRGRDCAPVGGECLLGQLCSSRTTVKQHRQEGQAPSWGKRTVHPWEVGACLCRRQSVTCATSKHEACLGGSTAIESLSCQHYHDEFQNSFHQKTCFCLAI